MNGARVGQCVLLLGLLGAGAACASGSENENGSMMGPIAGSSGAGGGAAATSTSPVIGAGGSGGSSGTGIKPAMPMAGGPPTSSGAGNGMLQAGAGAGAGGSAGMADAGGNAGNADAGGGAGMAGDTGSAGTMAESTEPKIPEPKGECQPFQTGDMTIAGSRFRIIAGPKKSKTGALLIYWYATGGTVFEVDQGVSQTAQKEIMDTGGIIAAMYGSTGAGMNTGDFVWFSGDLDVTDEVVACAVKEHDIDTHHIHALGWSAGGLQSGWMAYARSNYMASVAPYSGGSLNMMLQDPSNVPSAMLFHGAPGIDQVIIDFSQSSERMGMDLKMKGGFALNCNHGGAHMIPPRPGPDAAWLFFKAHGFKVKPSPWATMIPMGVPSYCMPY